MKKHIAFCAIAAAVIAASGNEAAEEDSAAPVAFARYETILERLPFGPLPPGFNPADINSSSQALKDKKSDAQISAEEKKLQAQLRVCAYNVAPDGRVYVGFIDNSAKPARCYHMKVGDTDDGWTLVSADDENSVRLEKDGVEVTLGIGAGAADHSPSASASAAAQPSAGGLPRRGLRPQSPAGPGGALGRLKERRERAEAERKEAENKRKAAEALEQADRERAAAEREQQQQQLLQIQEELRRQREERRQAERSAEDAHAFE